MQKKIDVNFDGKAFWLDRQPRLQGKVIVDDGVEDDPMAIRSFSEVGKLAAQYAFDNQVIEYHMCGSDYETRRTTEVDPLENYTPESAIEPSRSTSQGAILMFLNAVRNGKRFYVYSVVDPVPEARYAIRNKLGELPESLANEFVNTRCYHREKSADKWFADQNYRAWEGSRIWFGELKRHDDVISVIPVVIVRDNGDRQTIPVAVGKDEHGRWALFTHMMVEPGFEAK